MKKRLSYLNKTAPHKRYKQFTRHYETWFCPHLDLLGRHNHKILLFKVNQMDVLVTKCLFICTFKKHLAIRRQKNIGYYLTGQTGFINYNPTILNIELREIKVVSIF